MIGQLVDFIKVSISQHLGKVNWILLHDAIIFIVHLGKTLDGAKDWVHLGKKELIDTLKLIQILRQREILIRSYVVTSNVGNGDGCFVFSSPWTRTYLLKNFDFNFIAIVIDWWAEHELAAQVKLESDFYKKGGEKNWTKKHFLQFSNHRSSFVRSFVAREKEKSVITDFVILLFHFGILFAMKIWGEHNLLK